MDSTVERHGTYKNYDYLVINVHGTHFCAYVRIPEEHPFYKVPYGRIPIDCHGGLTLSEFTDFAPLKKLEYDSTFHGFFWSGKWVKENIQMGYWIGWDYAHLGDWMPYMPDENDKKWTPDEIALEAKLVIEQIVKEAENERR